jgi:hypothetical protein
VTGELETLAEVVAPEIAVPVKVTKFVLIGLAGLLIAALIIYVVWKLFFAEHAAEQKSQQVQTQAAIGKGQAGAAAGHDAIQITVDNSKAAAGIDAAVREAFHAIAKAKGADQQLDPELDDIGRRSICMRASAASLSDCQHLQHPDP